MQDKELESLLQEKADKVTLREFSQVWEEIKGEIQLPEKKRKFSWKKRFSVILASALVVVCAALSPLIINALTPAEEVFFTDELSQQEVLQEEMFDGLAQAQIKHVDLEEYAVEDCKLIVTETNQVKGASFTFYNEQASFLAEMKMYDKSVDLNLDMDLYREHTCKINSAEINYKFLQESDGLYIYNVYAVNNGVQYVIKYTGLSDNITEFLTEFFG